MFVKIYKNENIGNQILININIHGFLMKFYYDKSEYVTRFTRKSKEERISDALVLGFGELTKNEYI